MMVYVRVGSLLLQHCIFSQPEENVGKNLKVEIYSPTGKNFHLPDLFAVHMPRQFIDGEIW